MIDFLNNNYSQIITSLISGLIFIVLVFIFFRPWMLISNKISLRDNNYTFKIINCTFFKCTDFQIYLRKVITKDSERGKNKNFEIIDSKPKPYIYAPSVWAVLFSSSLNCIIPKYNHKIEELLKVDGVHLELVVISKHGLSGVEKSA